MQLVIVRDKDKVALVQRPTTSRFLKETWGLVTESLGDVGASPKTGASRARKLPKAARAIGSVRHSITHHKIEASVLVASRGTVKLPASARWLETDAVEEALVSNLDRKAWHLYLKKRAAEAEPPLPGPSSSP